MKSFVLYGNSGRTLVKQIIIYALFLSVVCCKLLCFVYITTGTMYQIYD